MAYLVLTASNLKLLKDQIRLEYEAPSSHLTEALAAALGFKSHAALNAHLAKEASGDAWIKPLSDEAFLARLSELGSPIEDWRGFSSFRSEAVIYEDEPRFRADGGGPFRIVYNFWLAPDFERVLAGKAKPPFVDHDQVDFEYLRSVIADEFRFGSPVEIRLANDTVDQVTVHFREAMGNPNLIQCKDFADKLLAAAKKQDSRVIDIRNDWAPLHKLKERRHAPPPILIPIVVEAYDVEDAVIWCQQAGMRLGVRAANPEIFMDMTRKTLDDDKQGYLTKRLHAVLAQCFGTPYKPFCMLDMAATDQLPPDFLIPGF